MTDQFTDIELITTISFLGLGYFVVIMIAMHKLRPDYNPVSRYINDARNGWI